MLSTRPVQIYAQALTHGDRRHGFARLVWFSMVEGEEAKCAGHELQTRCSRFDNQLPIRSGKKSRRLFARLLTGVMTLLLR